MKAQPGRLVLVATPIGNLGDLSPRAVEALGGADVILCEDTRRTRTLLTHAGLSGRRLVAMDANREAAAVTRVLGLIREGRTVALATDAGMPAVSDPGARLVAAVAAAGEEVVVVPGPSAALAALVVSGLPTDRFVFEGFLPRKGSERAARLEALAGEVRTSVIFEAPLRLGATLADLAGACGSERPVAVARELTKLHEEVWRGSLGEAAALAACAPPRGEQVIVLGGLAPDAVAPDDQTVGAALRERLEAGDSARDAARTVAAELGIPRRRAYELALRSR
ncbi:MAG: 16S rRNA (cytidine(1402)-2'-O)-methyltransferase [Acidimicrobiales bacterium]